MDCCQCQGIETLFDKKYVLKELARYREKGPDKSTRILIDALKAEGVEGKDAPRHWRRRRGHSTRIVEGRCQDDSHG